MPRSGSIEHSNVGTANDKLFEGIVNIKGATSGRLDISSEIRFYMYLMWFVEEFKYGKAIILPLITNSM
jgi:hypothetical protein